MILKFNSQLYHSRRDFKGEMVVILNGKLDDRKLQIEHHYARALCKHQIHEMITTDEKNIVLGQEVNRVGYIGFIEVQEGAHVILGDKVYINDTYVGEVVGFDDIHMPNHMNIIVFNENRASGPELGLSVGDSVWIGKNKASLPTSS